MAKYLSHEKLRSVLQNVFSKKEDSGLYVDRVNKYLLTINLSYYADRILDDMEIIRGFIISRMVDEHKGDNNEKGSYVSIISVYRELYQDLLKGYFPTSKIVITERRVNADYISNYLAFKISDEDILAHKMNKD